MPLVVHKYGGSSVANAEMIQNVARRIAKVRKQGTGVVAVVSAMGDTTDDLIELAHSVSDQPHPRELDLLLSTGELVSCTLLTMALADLGQEAVSLTGSQAGIHTDTSHGRARIHRVDTARMLEELQEGRIVVVAGFQGITEDEDITTLGRGGSDTTAVALAAALEADRCEIYTDVDGIYTADPRIVPEARKLSEISYDEMLELANYGAKMHPRSIELGAVYNVPIYVASSFNDTPGTLIHGNVDKRDMEDRIKVTGIACTTNVAKITLRSVPDRPGVAAALFEPLAQSGISVDTIVQNTSEDRTTDISFTVSGTDLQAALAKVGETAKEIGSGALISEAGLAAVSVVGSGMQHTPGYASRMFRVLADGNVNIDMITTSEIRISCIIREEQAEEAVRLLHRGFQLDEPDSE
ncbi:MAG: aspartate kinase [Chloroflexi bacterium]|nr:aspartate kinase [Chloroflexota bacterium]MCH8800530.1 aspartate kinase [Chloroflexota bacterium]MCH8891896.1 aspartate kinase [Chloroflexota bacterium]MCI0800815.1 aspartate kinase [Chloroflexota bacterium]MCI0810657.1 aspartate kinase [Chloroflexota bacterium]